MLTSSGQWFTTWLWTVQCHNRGLRGQDFWLGESSAAVGENANMESMHPADKLAGIVLLASAAFAAGEGRRALRNTVGPHPPVSITNEYRPTPAQPGAAHPLLGPAVTQSA